MILRVPRVHAYISHVFCKFWQCRRGAVSQIESDRVTFATARPRGVVTLVADRVLSISMTPINREQGSSFPVR